MRSTAPPAAAARIDEPGDPGARRRPQVIHARNGRVLAVQCSCGMWVHPSITECLSTLAAEELRAVARTPGERLAATAADEPSTAAAAALTLLERRVLSCLAAGRGQGAAARELYVSEDTIKNAARAVRKKLAVGSNCEAVLTGFRMGLLR